MTAWDPTEYLRFGDERTRPAVDLAARVGVDEPASIIDLGCGPGNSAQVLRRRWPSARVRGLDSSSEMIDSARRSYPEQEWMLGGIEDWTADVPYDVVFSNAALQWLPDHVALTRRLFAQVAEGGALAFQIPSRDYSQVRKLIHEISRDEAWASRTAEAGAAHTMEAPGTYYDALAPRARAVDIWETQYFHVMDSPWAIVEWISSTGLRPFLDALDSDDERRRFTGLLADRVAAEYESKADGRVLFPFRRTFVIAYT
jgi:trans-aconitate 2-methyltransferase